MDLLPCSAASHSGSSSARERCDDRARRLIRVKFVSLPMELDPGLRRDDDSPALIVTPAVIVTPALIVTPAQAGAQFLARMRALLFRVIGRLEAARP